MSRAESIQVPRWRVQVFSPLGEVTHESGFKTAERAEEYFGTLSLPDSVKRLQVRSSGAKRFSLIRREVMVAKPLLMNNAAATETQAYEALRLAQLNAHKGSLASSAAMCVADALACFNAGDYAHAIVRARESLRYSVGVFHPDYAKVAS